MKNTFRIITLIAILHANSVFAASGTEGSRMGLIGWIFIGFMALIISFQFIPAAMMLVGFVKALVSRKEAPEAESTAK